jgi:hypothetical protein
MNDYVHYLKKSASLGSIVPVNDYLDLLIAAFTGILSHR